MNNMQFSLDFRSEVSAAAQIIEQVRQRIANGELQPGDQLPTVRQLASDLRVNFNTIARAYRMLDEAGLISTQRERGTYVLSADEESQSRARKTITLETQIEQFLSTLHKQGYSSEEMASCFADSLQALREGSLNNDKE